MTTNIHMGRVLRDIVVSQEEDGLIRLEQDQQAVRLTPEGARSLAFIIMGMTDRPLKPGQLTGKLCSICGEPQIHSPGGITCSNGHGGADPIDE